VTQYSPRPRIAGLTGFLALVAALTLSACGGGGGGGGGGSNVAPTASFTATPACGLVPLALTVDASASSDPDGSIASYSWNFGDGTTGSGPSATHTYTTTGTYTLKLTVQDNSGKASSAQRSVTVSAGPLPASVAVSGHVTYDRVPFETTLGGGLDYGRITPTPARGIVVDLIRNADQGVIATTNTDANGYYSFAGVPINIDVKVRAKAQSRSTSGATWNIQVKDNTNSKALYVMDSSAFNSCIADTTKDMEADSGWPAFGGASYINPRVAAPFAILDSVYSAVQFVVAEGDDPAIAFPALNVYWSPSNRSSTSFTPSSGNIQTTQYRSGGADGGIYVLGNQNVDTDEYDEHVLTHEFQHYLQDATSRDDTMGGSHSFLEKLDLRMAFSEGYANAFSGMPLDDPVYRDSNGTSQGNDAFFNLETTAVEPKGWYNESTIAALAWDLFDTTNDDTVAIPYASIATVFRTTLRTGQPLTSIFPLIVALKTANPGSAAAINTLVGNNGMVATTMDPFGSSETNTGGNADALPIYSNVALNGAAVKVCGNRDEGIYNKLANRRFLKFTLNSTVNATIRAVYTSNGSDTGGTPVAPDPDLVLYKGGSIATSESDAANEENMVRMLDAGDYVIEVYEYSHIEDPSTGTARGRTCYNITLTG